MSFRFYSTAAISSVNILIVVCFHFKLIIDKKKKTHFLSKSVHVVLFRIVLKWEKKVHDFLNDVFKLLLFKLDFLTKTIHIDKDCIVCLIPEGN